MKPDPSISFGHQHKNNALLPSNFFSFGEKSQ